MRGLTRHSLLVLVVALGIASVTAQNFAITNARIVTVSDDVIERGTVVIVDGKIQAVGARASIPSRTKRIDGRGLTVYPGIFNADTQLGLTEIGAVAVTNDTSEMGDYMPQLMAFSAVHVESEHIPVARVDGITHAVTRPSGGVIAGQGAIIHLDGWSVEEMAIERGGALYLNLPSLLRLGRRGFFGGGGGTFRDQEKRFKERTTELKELFERVRQYAAQDAGRRNYDRRLEALVPAIKGDQPVVISADSHVDIKKAVEFAQENHLNYLILGAADAWMVADYLKENNVRVILGPRQSLPRRPDDPIDIIYETPRILEEKGVRFALATGGSANARTLPFEVGNSIAHGLSQDAALRSITLTPAEFFGIEDRLGSIEAGKTANLVVADGDIFDYQTKIRHVFVNGQDSSLESKHTRLYEKYRRRP